ncbi:MAG: redoxin family protein [Candidatus Eisenbacteria bacterium]|uniref:Redoxin family protein n=1 Tax=Eiseniibacteriota bacterium TaxID=2212470 RepID=A0A7Y2E8D8_UNCEI|nr:redoxin family protein [Candidatus Eisenbacteria bacterium]
MSEFTGTKKVATSLILLGLAISLGVLAGKRYPEWRQNRDHEQKLNAIRTGEATELQAGRLFPNLQILDTEGTASNTDDLLEQNDSVILLLTTDCEPCHDSIFHWSRSVASITDVQFLFLAVDEPGLVYDYAQSLEFPVPLYCDDTQRLATEFGVNLYPTIVGVDQNKRIRFVRHGLDSDFDPPTAAELLRSQIDGEKTAQSGEE